MGLTPTLPVLDSSLLFNKRSAVVLHLGIMLSSQLEPPISKSLLERLDFSGIMATIQETSGAQLAAL